MDEVEEVKKCESVKETVAYLWYKENYPELDPTLESFRTLCTEIGLDEEYRIRIKDYSKFLSYFSNAKKKNE